jgi:hypothetical protein
VHSDGPILCSDGIVSRFTSQCVSERTYFGVRTNLAKSLCLLPCSNGKRTELPVSSNWCAWPNEPFFVSKRALQKVHTCDFTCVCPDGPLMCPNKFLLKLAEGVFQPISPVFFHFHTIFLFSLLGFWPKIIDLDRLNVTPKKFIRMTNNTLI